MEAEKLVSMANQIASFFKAYPEDAAIIGVRDHLKSFWTQGMRRTLGECALAGHAGIDPLVMAAVTAPRPDGESPIRKQVQGPDAIGQLASDAG